MLCAQGAAMNAKMFALCSVKMPVSIMRYHHQKFVMVHAMNVLRDARVHALKRKR